MSGESEKIPTEEVKFIPGGSEEKIPAKKDPESGKEADSDAFIGLTKDELQRYADDPFWVRTRKILFILFWVVWFGMVAAAIIIIVLSPKCPARPNQKWWETSVVYRVDVRTFKDSNKDGLGDFKGLESELKYLKGLGVGAICLRPVFETAGKDKLRRDVVDFKAVDGEVGNLAEFKSLAKAIHKMGMKILLEFLPNHSSKEHRFFVESRQKKAGYENFYVWQDAVPNDWKSVDDASKSAWTMDDDRKAYYYHVHAEDLPDLNLRDEAVKTEIKEALKFWLVEEQVDGVLIPEVDRLVESDNLAGNYEGWHHQAESAEFIAELRSVVDEVSEDTGKDRALIVDVEDGNATQKILFYGTAAKPGAHLVVNDRLVSALKTDCNGSAPTGICIEKPLQESMKIIRESNQKESNEDRPWYNWILSSMDGRIASKVDAAYVDAFNLLMLSVQGTPFVFYGDELGMKDSNDVDYKALSVMQWDSSKNGGFSSASTRFPVDPDYATLNVKFQNARGNDDSRLNAFKTIANLRKENSFAYGDIKVYTANQKLLTFIRHAKGHPAYFVAINFGDKPATAPGENFDVTDVPDACEVVATTSGVHEGFKVGSVFDPKKIHLLLQKGDGIVVKLGRK